MDSSGSRNLEVLGLGWSLGWRIAAGFLLGVWLDGRFDSAPWLTLLLSLAALTAGVIQIVRVTAPGVGESGDKAERTDVDRLP